MSRASEWMIARGLRPQALRDRALAGVGIGLMVVLIDRMMGLSS
ncbi:hypothetical protein HD841_001660 [Sphingomonas melonis]|jgi:hypothetical protein|uniref:Uncharacterized protein n=1 Tax=Sphingomonas melonis TaxID=152682 RepID=A0A7Y9FM86_9SPHN|nr:hypothetical protein [Sphingomonas melonis]